VKRAGDWLEIVVLAAVIAILGVAIVRGMPRGGRSQGCAPTPAAIEPCRR
jgi:hypothetical protein